MTDDLKEEVKQEAADSGSSPTSSPDEGQKSEAVPGGQGTGRRRIWLLAGLAGVVVLLTGIIATSSMLRKAEPSHSDSSQSTSTYLEKVEILPDFFVPLQPLGEHSLVKVSVGVSWPQGAKARFKEKQVAIRNEIYQSLTAQADSGSMRKRQAEMEEEITRILEFWLQTSELSAWIENITVL